MQHKAGRVFLDLQRFFPLVSAERKKKNGRFPRRIWVGSHFYGFLDRVKTRRNTAFLCGWLLVMSLFYKFIIT